MKKKQWLSVARFVLPAILLASCNSSHNIKPTQDAVAKEEAIAVGGDRDEHGCIGSAGYVWSVAMTSCIRVWEVAKPINTVGASANPTGFTLIYKGAALPIEVYDEKGQNFILSPNGKNTWQSSKDELFATAQIIAPKNEIAITIMRKSGLGINQIIGSSIWPYE